MRTCASLHAARFHRPGALRLDACSHLGFASALLLVLPLKARCFSSRPAIFPEIIGRSVHCAILSVFCRTMPKWFLISLGALLAQVHGHDFSCVAALPPSTHAAEASGAVREVDPASNAPEGASPQFTYVSGSEEKVLRVLEAPQAFHDTLALARGGAPGASSQARA